MLRGLVGSEMCIGNSPNAVLQVVGVALCPNGCPWDTRRALAGIGVEMRKRAATMVRACLPQLPPDEQALPLSAYLTALGAPADVRATPRGGFGLSFIHL